MSIEQLRLAKTNIDNLRLFSDRKPYQALGVKTFSLGELNHYRAIKVITPDNNWFVKAVKKIHNFTLILIQSFKRRFIFGDSSLESLVILRKSIKHLRLKFEHAALTPDLLTDFAKNEIQIIDLADAVQRVLQKIPQFQMERESGIDRLKKISSEKLEKEKQELAKLKIEAELLSASLEQRCSFFESANELSAEVGPNNEVLENTITSRFSNERLISKLFGTFLSPSTIANPKKSHLALANQIKDPSFKIPRKEIKTFLKDQFGAAYAKSLLSLYPFEKNGELNLDELQALFVSTIANLTESALEHLWEKGSHSIILQQTLKRLANDHPIKEIRIDAPFQTLTGEQKHHIVRALRSINMHSIKTTLIEHPKFGPQIARDMGIISACNELSEYGPSEKGHALRHFAGDEYLSRQVVYRYFYQNDSKQIEGTLFPSYDPDFAPNCLESTTLISKPGLHGIILRPLNPTNNRPFDVRIVFRGTQDKYSMYRNFSLLEKRRLHINEGPGSKSFRNAKKEILSNFKSFVESHLPKEGYCLKLMGHSLGATDAQRAFISFANLFAHSEFVRPVHGMELISVNPPGIEKKPAYNFLKAANLLQDMKIKITHLKTKGDLVQRAGQCLLGYRRKNKKGFKLSPHLKITIANFKRKDYESKSAFEKKIPEHGLKKYILKAVRKPYFAHVKSMTALHRHPNTDQPTPVYLKNIYTNDYEDTGKDLEKKSKKSHITAPKKLNALLITDKQNA